MMKLILEFSDLEYDNIEKAFAVIKRGGGK